MPSRNSGDTGKGKKVGTLRAKKPSGRSAPVAADPAVAAMDALYEAVVDYVMVNGGKLLVVGGIEVQEWPGEPAGKFKLAVECLGRKPIVPMSFREIPRPKASPGAKRKGSNPPKSKRSNHAA